MKVRETLLQRAVREGERLFPSKPRRWLCQFGSINPHTDLESGREREWLIFVH